MQVNIQIISENRDVHESVNAADVREAVVLESSMTLESFGPPPTSEAPSLIIVDLTSNADRKMAALERLVREYPSLAFAIVCDEMQMELVLRAMRIGIRHCIQTASVGAELPGVIHEIVAAGATSSGQGQVITVVSAGGGCGATTLSVNIASELKLCTEAPCALIDLDTAYGAMATHLGVEGRFGIHDVLADASRIDGELVRSTATDHPSGLEVFLSPFTTGASVSNFRLDNLERTLGVMRQTYRYTVIDAPRLALDIAAELICSSDTVLMAMELTVPHLRTGRQLVGELRARGFSSGALIPIGCRYRRRSDQIPLKDASRTLGGLSIEPLSNDFETVNGSQMLGKTLAEHAPRSKVRREIQALADRFVSARQAGAA